MNLIADLLMVWKNYFKIQKIMQRSERRNAKVTSLKAIVNMVIDVTLNIKVDQPNKHYNGVNSTEVTYYNFIQNYF
jgi:hypothetical protein